MHSLRVLRREYSGQIATSRNLREGIKTKCRRAFWCAIFTIKGIRVGLRNMGRESLGERVIYDGRPCVVSNWAGGPAPTLSGKDFYSQHCDRSKIVSVGGLQKYTHRFRVGFSWYMGSWFDIHVSKRIYPR